MSLREKKKRKLLGKCATLAKDLQCIAEPYTHVRVTHIPKKTTAEIPLGSGEVGVSHVLINAALIPLS